MDVSVIMPAYNAEKYIGEALESVLSQRFSGSYDILIADDASSDSTPEIIKSYQVKFPSLIKAVFRQTNIGANPNSFDLCKCATGQYLAFIDADDIWVTNDKLQRQFDFLESHSSIGAVCSNSYCINDQSVETITGGPEGLVTFMEMICGHTDIYCSSLLCKKEVYNHMVEDSKWYIDNGCFNDTVWAFWLSYYNLLYRMRDPLCKYRVLNDSACHSTDKEKQAFLGKRYFLKKLCFLFSHDYPVDVKMEIISNEYDYFWRHAFFEGEMKVRNTKSFKIGKRLKELTNIFVHK